MKIKKIILTVCVIFLCISAFSAEITAGFNMNNFSNGMLPGISFLYSHDLFNSFFLNFGLKNQRYTKNYVFGDVIYYTPTFKEWGAYVGFGPLFALNTNGINAGYEVLTGFIFPKKISLNMTSGFVVKPENIFSFSEYVSQVKLNFNPQNQKAAIVYNYHRFTENNSVSRIHKAEICVTGFVPSAIFSLTANAGLEFLQSESNPFDIAILLKIGAAYYAKKIGTYGLYADFSKSIIQNEKTPFFAVVFEYAFKY